MPGMIFASYNEQIEPLDFLGGAKHWMDLFMKQGAGLPDQDPGRTQVQLQGQLEDPAGKHHRRLSLPDRAQVVHVLGG
jgi:hypothetical protein